MDAIVTAVLRFRPRRLLLCRHIWLILCFLLLLLLLLLLGLSLCSLSLPRAGLRSVSPLGLTCLASGLQLLQAGS